MIRRPPSPPLFPYPTLSRSQQTVANVFYKPTLPLAIAGGYDANGNAVAGGAYSRVYGGFSTSNPLVLQPALDPFARTAGVNPASIANLYGTEQINATSRLASWDGKPFGAGFDLPAGGGKFSARP